MSVAVNPSVRADPARCSQVPGPVARLLAGAELAPLPRGAGDLRLDSERGPGVIKTLMSFTVERAALNLFLLTSPGLRELSASRLDPWWEDCDGDVVPETDMVAATEEDRIDPAHPWWGPESFSPARRYAYTTGEFDFVELIVDDLPKRVHIRAFQS